MRKKPHKVSAWLTDDAFSHLKKVMKTRRLNQTKALECILTHEDATPQELLNYRHCQHREAYPEDPNFCRCYKDDPKKGRLIEQDICQACGLLKVIEVPLKTKQRLQQEISGLQNRKEELKAEIKNIEEPQSQIGKLMRDLEDRDRKIEEIEKQPKFEEGKLTATMALLKEEIATLQTDNEQLREQCQFSKIESKGEHQVMEKPQVIERTTEKTEKTTVKEIVPPAAVIVEKVSCPHFAKTINQPEITKEQCIKIQKYRPELCSSVQCSEFLLKPQA